MILIILSYLRSLSGHCSILEEKYNKIKHFVGSQQLFFGSTINVLALEKLTILWKYNFQFTLIRNLSHIIIF